MNKDHQDIKEIVEDTVFNHKDSQGNSRFQREVHDAVFNSVNGEESRFQIELKRAFYGSIGKWLIGGGVVIIFAVAGLYYQVQGNTEAINEGGRYTETDAIEDDRLQEARDARQDEDIQNLRQEINNKLDQIIDRLIP